MIRFGLSPTTSYLRASRMKRTIPLVGELRDDPTERRLTPAEQDAERERQRQARATERAARAPTSVKR